jgi:GT2 family glycosyltransferase
VTTRFFATTDDDCIVDVHWVEALAAALAARPHEIVTGQVMGSDPGAPSTVTEERQRVFTRVPLKGDHFTGGNFGVALSIFRGVGDFDESQLVRFSEDNEWSFRALAKGHPIRFLPSVMITHLHWRDDTDMNQVYKQYARSQGGWYGRKLKEGDASFMVRVGYEVLRGAKRWAVGSATRDHLRKVNGRAFVIDLLRGVAAGWNERRDRTDAPAH